MGAIVTCSKWFVDASQRVRDDHKDKHEQEWPLVKEYFVFCSNTRSIQDNLLKHNNYPSIPWRLCFILVTLIIPSSIKKLKLQYFLKQATHVSLKTNSKVASHDWSFINLRSNVQRREYNTATMSKLSNWLRSFY